MDRQSSHREAIEAEIDRVRSLGLDALRSLWRRTLRSSPPAAFTKDLMARFLCWHIQEQALGGLDPHTAKLLARFEPGAKPGADSARRLKPGTALVREYRGERHTVTVVPGGYVWREETYASLSIIARAITGTAWSGPRFFGVRNGDNSPPVAESDPRKSARSAEARQSAVRDRANSVQVTDGSPTKSRGVAKANRSDRRRGASALPRKVQQ
jgi:hypothetical protein